MRAELNSESFLPSLQSFDNLSFRRLVQPGLVGSKGGERDDSHEGGVHTFRCGFPRQQGLKNGSVPVVGINVHVDDGCRGATVITEQVKPVDGFQRRFGQTY